MSAAEDALSGLVGTWQTESIGGVPLTEEVASTITFTGDGRVKGHGGVNSFGGSFAAGVDEVTVGPLAVTLKAGPASASGHEARLLAVLDGTRPFSIEGDVLTVGAGDDAARFRRVSAGHGDEAAGQLEVSGSVTYRQRVALPAGAVLTVRLSDVSVADAPSTTIAEQVITPEHQVPIPFSLAVERGALVEGRTYAVSARITVDGRLRWTSDTHIPVTASAPTSGIDILVVPA